MRKKRFFFVCFPEFFRFLSKNFSDFWPKNFKKFSKLPSACPDEHFVTLIFFKVLNLFGFSAETLVWFSKNYLSVQSKNCGKKVFFCFLSRTFSIFEQKFFRLLAKKLQKFSKITSTCPEELFVTWTFVPKFWIVLGFLQKLLAWFSKFYLRVQSKKCGKKVFFCFLSRIFSIFEQKFFGLWAKKLQKVFKTTF